MPYAVMELLDGRTLREVLADGALPPRKTIEYATQIAAGLAAAHARGITHRDLKPENVFVTREGRVKILDFGLAKVAAPAGAPAASLAATFSPTSPGTVLGTVGYMSPEQVRGQEVDHRSDIFALGAILYEALAGQRAFSGPSPVETMNAILKEEPPELTRANATLPPSLDRIVRRCLEKNPDERFQSARDLGFALEALSGTSSSSASMTAVSRERRWVRPVLAVVAVVGALAVGVVAGRSTAQSVVPTQISFETKTFEPQMIFNARFVPDGQTIVFSAALEGNSPELFVSRPGAVAPQALGVKRAHLLSVSSTGELAVLTDTVYLGHRLFRGTLARMPIDGAPRPWLENVREADWSPDGSTLALIRDTGLTDRLEYPIGTVLHEAAGYLSDVRVSPDGNRVVFMEHPARYDDRGWVKVVDRGGTVRTLAGEYWGEEGLAWAPDGETILYSGGDAGSEAYQPHAVNVDGAPVSRPVLPSPGAVFLLDIARDGRWLVTRNDDHLSIRALLPGQSAEREFSWLGAAIGSSLSRDGRLILFTDQSQSAGTNYSVNIRKADGSPALRLGEGAAVAFSPDGTRVLAQLFNPAQLAVVYPVGAGDAIRLNPGPLERVQARQWVPDGRRVVVCGNEPSRPFRCYQQDLVGGLPAQLTPEGLDVGPVSPDAQRLVVIAPDRTKHIFSLADATRQPARGVMADDTVVAWSSDGRSLFVAETAAIPVRIERVDLDSGTRALVREVALPDRAGLLRLFGFSILNDGQAYAYTYWRRVARLFVVSGASPAG